MDAKDQRIAALEAQVKGLQEYNQQLIEDIATRTPEHFTEAYQRVQDDALAVKRQELEARARIAQLEAENARLQAAVDSAIRKLFAVVSRVEWVNAGYDPQEYDDMVKAFEDTPGA